jgi:hypothetical protein
MIPYPPFFFYIIYKSSDPFGFVLGFLHIKFNVFFSRIIWGRGKKVGRRKIQENEVKGKSFPLSRCFFFFLNDVKGKIYIHIFWKWNEEHKEGKISKNKTNIMFLEFNLTNRLCSGKKLEFRKFPTHLLCKSIESSVNVDLQIKFSFHFPFSSISLVPKKWKFLEILVFFPLTFHSSECNADHFIIRS